MNVTGCKNESWINIHNNSILILSLYNFPAPGISTSSSRLTREKFVKIPLWVDWRILWNILQEWEYPHNECIRSVWYIGTRTITSVWNFSTTGTDALYILPHMLSNTYITAVSRNVSEQKEGNLEEKEHEYFIICQDIYMNSQDIVQYSIHTRNQVCLD